MESIKDSQAVIAELEKSISLNQIAHRSGMNYITLRNIKLGKSANVTESVARRLREFAATFTPPQDAGARPRRGRKPKAVAAKTQPAQSSAPKKRGRPKKDAAAAVPVAVESEVAPVVKRKAGRPRKTVDAAAQTASAPKKRGRKPGTGRKIAPVMRAAAPEFPSIILGEELTRQIKMLEARLAYLRSLEKAEAEFIAKMGGKK